MKKGISLCMIVRDEEADLAGCLDSVQDLVSEIVIVDTGSVDKTKEIAARYSAKIIDFVWNDDFSAPRNISLKAAGYDWILVLDADERLDRSDFAEIRQLTQHRNAAYKLIQRHYRNDPGLVGFKTCQGRFPEWEKGWIGYVESELVRLFPNDSRLKYSNCMHELLEGSVRANPEFKLTDTGIRLHHFDHARSMQRREWKNSLYARLAQKKAELMSDHWKAHFELGLDFNCRKQFAMAIEPLLKAHRLEPTQIDPLLALGHAYGELAKYKEAELCFVQILKINSRCFQAASHLGVVYLKAGRADLAVKVFSEAMKLEPEDIGNLVNLGEAFIHLADYPSASTAFLRALALVPNHSRALVGLGISQCHLADYGKSEEIFLTLKQLKHDQTIVSYWLSEIYRLSGRVEEATDLIAQLLRTIPANTKDPLRRELEKRFDQLSNMPG